MTIAARTTMTALLALSALAALSACGARKELQRPEGMSAVPTARGAEEPAAPEQLMRSGEQARPDRSAEPLKQSQERQVDPFDLPPS